MRVQYTEIICVCLIGTGTDHCLRKAAVLNIQMTAGDPHLMLEGSALGCRSQLSRRRSASKSSAKAEGPQRLMRRLQRREL